VAVLYRNNSSSIALMNEFDRAGIPFYMKDADNRFFSHWVVEDILNFMRMTFTDKRPEILEKIHFKFNGYISKQQMAELKEINNNESVFDNLLNYVQVQDYQIKQLKAGKETFQQMRGMPPLHAIRVIRDRLGYEKALEKMCERFGFKKEYLIGILNTLEEIADTLETMEAFASRLKHLESVLKTAKSRKGQNTVMFSTFHSSKGLEFERVYMIDLIDGIIPSSDDQGSAPLMEEATRLFYVGMTRAKKHLELLVYRERDGEKATDSPFAAAVKNIINPQQNSEKESPKHHNTTTKKPSTSKGANRGQAKGRGGTVVDVPYNPNAIRNRSEFVLGKMVKHRAFGTGTIMKVEEERIHVRFEAREKVLLIAPCLEMGLLEPL
jgi:DNA helicase-2/ATP-dependent DNA helicase PcrA